jgi:DNA-binding NarL/FixJ family response regulator
MADHITNINLKVVLMDTDYYALQAINGYLAWDRRTRVTHMSDSLTDLWDYLRKTPVAELPDVVLLDADDVDDPQQLQQAITRLCTLVPQVSVLCLAQQPNVPRINVAAAAAARGYLIRGEVRSQIAWAIAIARLHEFLVTASIARVASLHEDMHSRARHAYVLPKAREYPQLTGRVGQAIELTVVKGLPAFLAADEMGISLHTIRSYIKEGYRILEAADDTEYPVNMSPAERAFMRLTHPEEDDTP